MPRPPPPRYFRVLVPSDHGWRQALDQIQGSREFLSAGPLGHTINGPEFTNVQDMEEDELDGLTGPNVTWKVCKRW